MPAFIALPRQRLYISRRIIATVQGSKTHFHGQTANTVERQGRRAALYRGVVRRQGLGTAALSVQDDRYLRPGAVDTATGGLFDPAPRGYVLIYRDKLWAVGQR